MKFNLLGPLELVVDGQRTTLRGVQQRAALGFLLLHANKIVATSKLLRALWSEDAPPTARKMLQNAVAGVRGVLSRDSGRSSALLTRPPGYLLSVTPEQIDLCRFQHLAESGRNRLAQGDWESAVATLCGALDLWRGPMLADLVEAGVRWPEFAVARNARLAALEDYAEAKLAMNQSQDVIVALEEALVDDKEPPRERLAGQLMIALYRTGRQADALSVYRRARAALIEQFGLDPSNELQGLERAILTHDPRLAAPVGRRAGSTAGPSSPGELSGTRFPVPPVWRPLTPRNAMARCSAGAAEDPSQPMCEWSPDDSHGQSALGKIANGEVKTITTLLLGADVGGPDGQLDPEDMWEARTVITTTFTRVVRRWGGSMRPETVGSLWMAEFGAPDTREDDAERAVCAALELQNWLVRSRADGRVPAERVTGRIALATGEALLTTQESDDHAAVTVVTARVVDSCLRLLTAAPPERVWVCDTTCTVSSRSFTFAPTADPLAWEVTGTAQPADVSPAPPLVGRDGESQRLHRLSADVRRQRRAHLVTVLGESGMGKSRLVAEFCRSSLGHPEAMRCVVARTSFRQESAQAMLVELTAVLAAETGTPSARPWLADSDAIFAAADQLITEVASQEPLAVVFEDLHRADEALLDFVEDLIRGATSLPLLVVVTARPELLERRPWWSGGMVASTTIPMEPLSDNAMRQLLTVLWTTGHVAGEPVGASVPADTSRFFHHLATKLSGNSLFATEYLHQLRSTRQPMRRPADSHPSSSGSGGWVGGGLAMPPRVRQVIAARLDRLPPSERAALRDAAVLGDEVCAEAMAVVSGRQVDEAASLLKRLERGELLRRRPGRSLVGEAMDRYAFCQPLVREVAYAQLPRSVCAARHYRAAMWLETQATSTVDQLASHYHHAINLSKEAGRPICDMVEQARSALSDTAFAWVEAGECRASGG